MDDLTTLFPTKVRNALRRAGISQPQSCTLLELMRVPGIGPQSIEIMATILYRYCVSNQWRDINGR